MKLASWYFTIPVLISNIFPQDIWQKKVKKITSYIAHTVYFSHLFSKKQGNYRKQQGKLRNTIIHKSTRKRERANINIIHVHYTTLEGTVFWPPFDALPKNQLNLHFLHCRNSISHPLTQWTWSASRSNPRPAGSHSNSWLLGNGLAWVYFCVCVCVKARHFVIVHSCYKDKPYLCWLYRLRRFLLFWLADPKDFLWPICCDLTFSIPSTVTISEPLSLCAAIS